MEKRRYLWHPDNTVLSFWDVAFRRADSQTGICGAGHIVRLNGRACDLQNVTGMSRKECASKFLQGICRNQASDGPALPKALLPPIYFSPTVIPPRRHVRTQTHFQCTRPSAHSPAYYVTGGGLSPSD